MKIRDLDISTVYIPKWNGNDTLPNDEQIIVEFKSIPKATQKNKYIKYEFSANSTVGIVKEYNLFCITHLKDITGLTVGNKSIRTAQDLLDVSNPAIVGLLDELLDYCFPNDELTPGE